MLGFNLLNASGGHRGGVPFYRDYRILADDAILQCRADRQVVRPYGLFGTPEIRRV